MAAFEGPFQGPSAIADPSGFLESRFGGERSDPVFEWIEEQARVVIESSQEPVDDRGVVDEVEIAGPMRLLLRSGGAVNEGAAGVAIAGLLARATDIAGRNVVVLICGGNISAATLNQLE